MYFKSEKKINFKNYIILALLLAIYFIGFTFISLYNSSQLSINADRIVMYAIVIPVAIVVTIFLLKEFAEII